MLAENQPPTDHTPTPEEVNVCFEAFATKHNQKEEMVLYMNDVAQDVKDLGETFPLQIQLLFFRLRTQFMSP